MNKNVKKVCGIVVDVLVVLVMLISAYVTIITFSSKATGYANIGGYSMFTVQSDSMEPIFYKGDIIFSKLVDETTECKTGDIVTFWTIIDNVRVMNTHKIVEISEKSGLTYYTTRGENAPEDDTSNITDGDIIGVYTGHRLRGVGNVMDFLQTQKGFFLCVLLPMILFFLYQLYRFIKNLLDYNKEKAQLAAEEAFKNGNTDMLTDEQKKKIAQEYLQSMKENQSSSDEEKKTAEAAEAQNETKPQ